MTGGPVQERAGSRPGDVEAVAENVSQLLRSFERAKAQLLARAEHDVEWSTHVLIRKLVQHGPLRASELSERVCSDPSTVSRQVAAMVKDGLIERQADPDDGRASLLVATQRGHLVHDAQMKVRNDHFARMLRDWSEDDCRQFATLLARFTTEYEAHRLTMFTDPAVSSSVTREEI